MFFVETEDFWNRAFPTATEMISDDKKIPLDKVTKHFFSCRKIIFLAIKTFFYCKKKNLGARKNSWDKNFCRFIKKNFLGIRNKLCE